MKFIHKAIFVIYIWERMREGATRLDI